MADGGLDPRRISAILLALSKRSDATSEGENLQRLCMAVSYRSSTVAAAGDSDEVLEREFLTRNTASTSWDITVLLHEQTDLIAFIEYLFHRKFDSTAATDIAGGTAVNLTEKIIDAVDSIQSWLRQHELSSRLLDAFSTILKSSGDKATIRRHVVTHAMVEIYFYNISGETSCLAGPNTRGLTQT